MQGFTEGRTLQRSGTLRLNFISFTFEASFAEGKILQSSSALRLNFFTLFLSNQVLPKAKSCKVQALCA